MREGKRRRRRREKKNNQKRGGEEILVEVGSGERLSPIRVKAGCGGAVTACGGSTQYCVVYPYDTIISQYITLNTIAK